MKDFFRKLFFKLLLANCTNPIGEHFKFQSRLLQYIKEISVKYNTSIWFVQVWVVLDSDNIQIYESCQYSFNPLNSTGDKSDWTFQKEIIYCGYEFCRTGLFSVKNWEVSKYLETFSNFSIKILELPLFKEEVYQKIKPVKFFTT